MRCKFLHERWQSHAQSGHPKARPVCRNDRRVGNPCLEQKSERCSAGADRKCPNTATIELRDCSLASLRLGKTQFCPGTPVHRKRRYATPAQIVGQRVEIGVGGGIARLTGLAEQAAER